MCLLIVAKKEFPSVSVLRSAEMSNRDGGGIAWVEDGKVRWHKGIKVDDMLQYEAKGGPWLIHFRLATVGGKGAALCHPFPVDTEVNLSLQGKADRVLGHNGHFAQWDKMILNSLDSKSKLPDGPWSDTRGIAYLTAKYGESFLTLIDEKIAILDSTGEIKIFSPNKWHKETGKEIFYSNNPYVRSWGPHCYGYDQEWPGTSNSTIGKTIPCNTPTVKTSFFNESKDVIIQQGNNSYSPTTFGLPKKVLPPKM
jgi:hypothetical protein